MAELSIKQKKEWALELFTSGEHTQKAIAAKVDISERTLSKWVNDEQWEQRRRSLLITRKEQLTMLYNQIEALNTSIKEKQGNIPTSKDSDTILKLTAAIKNLEKEISLTDVFEVGKAFITWLQTTDFEASKEVLGYYDGFVNHCIKTLSNGTK